MQQEDSSKERGSITYKRGNDRSHKALVHQSGTSHMARYVARHLKMNVWKHETYHTEVAWPQHLPHAICMPRQEWTSSLFIIIFFQHANCHLPQILMKLLQANLLYTTNLTQKMKYKMWYTNENFQKYGKHIVVLKQGFYGNSSAKRAQKTTDGW